MDLDFDDLAGISEAFRLFRVLWYNVVLSTFSTEEALLQANFIPIIMARVVTVALYTLDPYLPILPSVAQCVPRKQPTLADTVGDRIHVPHRRLPSSI
jgi:hypothetical protein